MNIVLQMPALPTTPRLERLTAQAVADEVDQILARWIGLVREQHPLGFTKQPSLLAGRVHALAEWTQTEQGLSAFELDETLIDVMSVLYRRPIDQKAPPIPEIDTILYADFREEPINAVTCVVLAALARRALHPRPAPGRTARVPRGVLVSVPWLAALASVATSRVHQLRGRFNRVGTSISGKDAALYLTERGVLGFLPEPIDTWGREVRDFRLASAMSKRTEDSRMHVLLNEYHRLRKEPFKPEALAGLERLFRTHRQLAAPGRHLRTLRKG